MIDTGARLELTPAQREAIDHREGSYLLTATAGSGKTRVIVERFVRAVVEDGVAPERILAITFTDKAAHELRTRVRERLVELRAGDAARDAEAASVSTIHGFCARVLRSHPLAAGLDPHFEVLDEARADRLRGLAFDAALRAFFNGEAGTSAERALDFAAAFGMYRLEQSIRGVHELLRSRGEAVPRLPVAVAQADPQAARAWFARALADAARELRAVERPGKAAISALATLVEAEQLLDAAFGERVSAAAVKALELGRTALATPVCSAYNAACAAWSQALADEQALMILPLLDGLLRAHGESYRRLKRARGVLDFDDLELETLELLRSHASLREAWAERFELAMVDEFQDTNPRQAALLELLERDNLFVVGDLFQSIYGFRHADPSLFASRRDLLAARGASGTLAENFRSHPDVLTCVNAAFAPRFGERFVELRAARVKGARGDQDAALEPGADLGAGPRVELLVTDTAGWESVAMLGGAGVVAAWRRAEARLVGQRLDELLGSGAASAAETVVLLRAGTDMATYERALTDRGVRTLAMGGGYWNALEVCDLRNYLRVLANPLDTSALYSLLGSPLVGLSADALAVLGIASQRLGRDPWWTAATDELADMDGGDRELLRAFVVRVTSDRRLAPRLALDVLLSRAVAAAGYQSHLLAQPGGGRRIANVDKLLRLARRFEASEGRDLRGLLDHLARLAAAVPREPDAPVEDDEQGGAVRLMTIHTAKGLEADVVCVADLGRARSNGGLPLLVDGGRVGISVPQPDGSARPALAHAELVAERRTAEEAEEDRILYVAMTRARERLLLSGGINLERWSQNGSSAPLAWLGPALVPELPGEPIADAFVTSGDGAAAIRLTINSPATVGTVLSDAAVGGLVGAAGRRAAAWPAAPAVPRPRSAPSALSYSGLSSYAACGYRYYLERVLGLPARREQRAGGAGGGLAALDRGTLVHALLERLDFGAPVAPVAEVVGRLAGELGLAVSEADIADLRGLVDGFASSPLRARLAAASDFHREHPFAFALGDDEEPLINGFFDVIARERDGTTLVVDYKSDRAGDAALEALTERDYGTQRLIYALAALRAGAGSVEVVHLYLERPSEPASAGYRAQDELRLTQAVRELSGSIAGGRFEVAAEPHRELCAGCPARRGLCSWDDEMTMRPGEGLRG